MLQDLCNHTNFRVLLNELSLTTILLELAACGPDRYYKAIYKATRLLYGQKDQGSFDTDIQYTL